MAKTPQFKLEIKLYRFVNRNTETSILYIRDIYTINQCFVTSVTAWLRRTTHLKRRGKPRQNSLFSAKIKKKKSIKCYRNCDETIMDVLLNFGPNWKRNDEEIIEKFQC